MSRLKLVLKNQPSFQVSVLLPTEIIVEILLRLPVKSLLRCKSVCKLWFSLISDHYFIKSHLALSNRNSDYAYHRLIYFRNCTTLDLKSCPLYDVMYHKDANNALELNYPFNHKPEHFLTVVGSCNGLVCIAIDKNTVFIWNPTTRRYNKLPPFFGSNWHGVYGFGYDESTDDYKVVEINRNIFANDSIVKIYSLKTGNWKKIGDSSRGIPIFRHGKFCNGAINWDASEYYGSPTLIIISLDLATETYGEILPPVCDKGYTGLTLGVLGQWLSVLCDYRENHADVWVMKVKDSWTKLVSIPYPPYTWIGTSPVPLCISNDGEVLVKMDHQLILFDSKNKSFSKIQNIDNSIIPYTFVESLVSPDAPAR